LGINDEGEIAGFGVTGTGDIHAFLATPRGREDHAREEGQASLPESVRILLKQKRLFGRFGTHFTGPR
jgi:hypothetical protein